MSNVNYVQGGILLGKEEGAVAKDIIQCFLRSSLLFFRMFGVFSFGMFGVFCSVIRAVNDAISCNGTFFWYFISASDLTTV